MVVGGEDDAVGVSSELKNDGVGRAVDDEGLLGLPVEEEDVVEGIEVVGFTAYKYFCFIKFFQ